MKFTYFLRLKTADLSVFFVLTTFALKKILEGLCFLKMLKVVTRLSTPENLLSFYYLLQQLKTKLMLNSSLKNAWLVSIGSRRSLHIRRRKDEVS